MTNFETTTVDKAGNVQTYQMGLGLVSVNELDVNVQLGSSEQRTNMEASFALKGGRNTLELLSRLSDFTVQAFGMSDLPADEREVLNREILKAFKGASDEIMTENSEPLANQIHGLSKIAADLNKLIVSNRVNITQQQASQALDQITELTQQVTATVGKAPQELQGFQDLKTSLTKLSRSSALDFKWKLDKNMLFTGIAAMGAATLLAQRREDRKRDARRR